MATKKNPSWYHTDDPVPANYEDVPNTKQVQSFTNKNYLGDALNNSANTPSWMESNQGVYGPISSKGLGSSSSYTKNAASNNANLSQTEMDSMFQDTPTKTTGLDGILNTIKNYLGKVSNEASNLVPDFLNPIKEVNKLKDSYSQYAQNNPDTPNILKPLGYALETPFRNPLVNNILGSAAKTVGGENAIADNAPIKQYSNSTGNKAIDTVGNYAGDMLGLLSTPITGIGTTTNKNLLNGADEIANLVSGKVASKLPDPLSNTLTTSLINGGINGGLGNALNSVRLNQNLSDTGKSALEGAIGGGLMFGSANLLGKAGSKLLNSNSLSDALTTSKNTIEDTIKNPTGTFKPTSSNKPIINTNELKTSENPPQSELNILNPKGKSFTQTILKDNIVKTDGYKTTLPIENRTPKNVGNKKVKAISYEYAELKPYLQNEAKQVLDELNSSTKGVRQVSYNNITGETAVAATKKNVSSTIQNIQNDIVNKKTGKTTVSYDQIRKGLEDIIHDNGRENNAVSKKIELSLDHRLTYGGADTLGNEVLPQTDYILTKADIEDLQNGTFKTGQAIIKKPITQKGINTLPTLEKPLSKALNENKTINPSIGATDRTKLNVDFTTGDNKQKLGLIANAKNSWDNFYTHAIDINNPIKKVDEKAYVIATNSKKASGTVSHILHDNLVDMKGNPIGEGLKSIAQDIPKNEEPDFFNYVFQRHNVDRAREGKNIDSNFTSEQSQKAVKLIEMKHPEYKALGDRLVNFTNKFMDAWGNKSGLVSDELWKNLQDTYKNYITSSRDFTDLEKGSVSANGKKGFVNQSSGLKKATGSDRNIINPIVNLSNLVDSTVRRARYNEVGQKLLNYAENNPTNESVVVIRNPDNINSNVNNIVSVLENGEKKYLEINDKNLLDALNNIYKSNDLNGFEQGLKTANNAFKSLITTKNPVFAFRNIARDVPTAYINGNENNPIKFFKDLGSAGKDIIKNSADYQKYKALGGESSNFFSPDNAHKTAQQLMDRKLLTDENVITGSKPINPVKKTLNKIGDKVEVFNNLTESVPRYAEFKRTLNKTGDVQKALYDAGEVTTNFSRGGDVTKKLDLGIPYLNAGVQGLDKLARQVKDKPLQTALKGATIVTAPTLILDAVNKNNPDYEALDNRTKDNNFLIPKGDGTFIKIPRSREYGAILGALTERILRKTNGEDNAFKGFGTTLSDNFAPPNPIENNLLAPIFSLKANKDFAGRAIIPQGMENRSPAMQYDENTTEIAKTLGSKLNMSPKQIDYLIKSYTGVIGQLGIPATTKSSYDSGNILSKVTNPITSQFTANPLKSNQNITDFYDNKDELTKTHNDFNFSSVPDKPQGMSNSKWSKLKPKSDTEDLYKLYNSVSSTIGDMRNDINNLNNQSGTQDQIKALQKQISDITKETNNIYKNPDKAKITEMTNKVKTIAKKYK